MGTGLNLFFSSFRLEEPGFCFHRKLYDQGRLFFLCSYEGLPWWLSGKESACNAGLQETQVWSLDWDDPLEEEMALLQ